MGYWAYESHYSAQAKLQELQEQKRELQQIVQRLSAERRIAEVLVTDQDTSADGLVRTTLLFVEDTRNGRSLPPKTFTVFGKLVHLDAMVIKFDHDFVSQNDPLRGHSIALFTRIFGDQQKPENGLLIDPPGTVPAVYRDAHDKVSAFEQALWADFWCLTDDPAYRHDKGVRIANGQGLWWPAEKDRLYTITLESDGGLNYTAEPLKPILREAMRRK